MCGRRRRRRLRRAAQRWRKPANAASGSDSCEANQGHCERFPSGHFARSDGDRERSRILASTSRPEMTAPSFVHLRLHSEFSVVDSTVRIDAAVAAAARDGMPALALTDLANAFGLIKFYKAARGAGIKPIAGCDVWITHDTERDRPFRAILLAASRDGYLKLCDWLSRAYRTNQHRGRAETAARVVRRRHGRLDRAVRRARRRCRPRAAAGQPRRARHAPRANGRRGSRSATTSKCSARGTRRTTRWWRPPSRSPASSRCRSSPRIRCSSSRAKTSARTRRACASPRARCCPTRGGRGASRPSNTSRRRPRWPRNSPTCPRRSPTRSRSRSAATSRFRSAGITCRNSRRRPASPSTSTCATKPRRDSSGAWRSLYPDAATRDAKRPEYVARLDFETKTIEQMGFAGYFLIVADFINWAKRNQRAGGAGPRLGRGFARRLFARHHRPRSAALRAALRALPQSRARVDARLRHRLLPERPRPRHRLRQEQVRRGLGVADRDVRHAGGARGGPRRRPRARHAVPRSSTASPS